MLSLNEKLDHQHFKNDLCKIYLDEEICWRQRSKVRWLKEDDNNTTFLHKVASFRRKYNWISDIHWEGQSLNYSTKIKEAFTYFFKKIFSKSKPFFLS